MPNNKIQVIFRQIDGIWQSINEQKPRTFADFLDLFNIKFDDRTQFLRIKYDYKKYLHTIEIRCYGGQIRCDICITHKW